MTKKKTIHNPQTMEDLLAQTGYELRGLKKGSIVSGTVSEIRSKTLFIDIGAKTEGVILGKELELVRDFVNQLSVGDKIDVQVRVPESERGQILLSLRQTAWDHGWSFFEEKMESSIDLEVYGKEENHGGLVVSAPFGLLGFIPGSQIGKKYDQDPAEMVGKNIKVKVLEVDRDKNRLVFSERLVSESGEVKAEKELVEKLKIGKEFEAEITRVEPFGLFVKVEVGDKPLEGLVHISEISWEKVENLATLYKVGANVQVQLLSKIDDRLQFSVKRLTKDPWSDIDKRYPNDKEVDGEVVRLASFGALVRLEPGIEGLVHISKIPPETKISVGAKVRCYIESLDKESRRLSLGLTITNKKIPIYK
ncbi:MAG: S1 RNA-binding domain-containing protein [Patescibacteria group bacterium]